MALSISLKEICIRNISSNPYFAKFIFVLPTTCLLLLNDAICKCNSVQTFREFIEYWPRKTFSFDISIEGKFFEIINAVKCTRIGKIKIFHIICEHEHVRNEHIRCTLNFLNLLRRNG